MTVKKEYCCCKFLPCCEQSKASQVPSLHLGLWARDPGMYHLMVSAISSCFSQQRESHLQGGSFTSCDPLKIKVIGLGRVENQLEFSFFSWLLKRYSSWRLFRPLNDWSSISDIWLKCRWSSAHWPRALNTPAGRWLIRLLNKSRTCKLLRSLNAFISITDIRFWCKSSTRRFVSPLKVLALMREIWFWFNTRRVHWLRGLNTWGGRILISLLNRNSFCRFSSPSNALKWTMTMVL